jgi:hypothetical protein
VGAGEEARAAEEEEEEEEEEDDDDEGRGGAGTWIVRPSPVRFTFPIGGSVSLESSSESTAEREEPAAFVRLRGVRSVM